MSGPGEEPPLSSLWASAPSRESCRPCWVAWRPSLGQGPPGPWLPGSVWLWGSPTRAVTRASPGMPGGAQGPCEPGLIYFTLAALPGKERHGGGVERSQRPRQEAVRGLGRGQEVFWRICRTESDRALQQMMREEPQRTQQGNLLRQRHCPDGARGGHCSVPMGVSSWGQARLEPTCDTGVRVLSGAGTPGAHPALLGHRPVGPAT